MGIFAFEAPGLFFRSLVPIDLFQFPCCGVSVSVDGGRKRWIHTFKGLGILGELFDNFTAETGGIAVLSLVSDVVTAAHPVDDISSGNHRVDEVCIANGGEERRVVDGGGGGKGGGDVGFKAG